MRRISQINDDDPPEIPFWKNRRVLGFSAIGLTAIALIGVIAGLVVYPKVLKWRQSKTIADAQTFLNSADYRSAQLLLEQAARGDPTNYGARRALADFYEKIGSIRSVEEWESLTKAEPGNKDNFLGLASAALSLGKIENVGPALAALEKAGAIGPEYFRMAAAYSLITQDRVALEKHLVAITQFEPEGPLPRFSLACVRLYSPQAEEVAAAREVLEEFARGDRLRIRATLQLIEDAPRRWPPEKNTPQLYVSLGKRILDPKSTTTGVMGRLGRGGEPGLRQLIEHMKAQPAPDPSDAALLAQWTTRIGLGREAQYWLESLPESQRRTPAVLGAMAEGAARLEDWEKLETLIQQGAWGRIPHDVIQLAFSARVLRQRTNSSVADEVWTNAVNLSSSSLAGLRALQRLAQLWQWPEFQTQTLTAMTREFPAERYAWQILAAQALAAGNSDQFWRVYSGWAQAGPGDVQVQAEHLMIGLLIRPLDPAFLTRAAELFRQNPENFICRIAQALALWRVDRAADGLALLRDRQIAYADEPRFALVNGLLLSSVGRSDESEQMLGLAAGTRLLPIEQKLLEQARARNRVTNRTPR